MTALPRLPLRLALCCLIGVLALGVLPDSADAARISTSITPGAQNTFLLVKVRRKAFARAIRARRAIRASLWVRFPAGWTRVYKRVLLQHRWTHSINTSRICRRSLGNTRVALQVGMRYGEYWWNRWTRRWQRKYISLRQSIVDVPCPSPTDQPPGAPPQAKMPAGPPLLPGFPPGRKPPVAQPPVGQPPVGQPPVGQPPVERGAPAEPPPPPVVSNRSFYMFYRSLKAASFSRTKLSTLRSWLQGLGPRKVKAHMVAKCIKSFSFSGGKLKAARMLSRHVLRPLRARQVVRIAKQFTHSGPKVKATLLFCRGIADSANVHLIASEFTFSSSKRKILRGCR